MNNLFQFLIVIFAISLASCSSSHEVKNQPSKPNILLIFVDDLGKEWISVYGAESIETPNI